MDRFLSDALATDYHKRVFAKIMLAIRYYLFDPLGLEPLVANGKLPAFVPSGDFLRQRPNPNSPKRDRQR